MAALKTTFVLFLLVLAGAVTYLSVERDPLGGEPYQIVKVDPADFQAMIRNAEAQAAAERQRELEQQQSQPQALSEANTPPQLEQTARPSPSKLPISGLDVPPVTGQAPPAVTVDPNGGITATDMLPQ